MVRNGFDGAEGWREGIKGVGHGTFTDASVCVLLGIAGDDQG